MSLLPDTHAFIWWLSGDMPLSQRAPEATGVQSGRVLVSAATSWEMAAKLRFGKQPGVAVIIADIERAWSQYCLEPLAVTIKHGQLAGTLQGDHRDPSDRILIAQAILEGLLLVSNDVIFDRFGVGRLW